MAHTLYQVPLGRFTITAHHSRFGDVVFLVTDEEVLDPLDDLPEIVAMEDSYSDAAAVILAMSTAATTDAGGITERELGR
jgi:hypothetical protein